MGFYQTKPAFREALRPLARRLAAIHPDVWTWLAVGVCGIAGTLLTVSGRQPVLLLVVPPLLFLRLLLNVFDGVAAQESGTSSVRGEAFSEFADRIADVAVLGGFALSGLGRLSLAVLAIVTVSMVSYVGILGKAVGAGRQYGGLMGKPDRMVVLMIASVLHYAAWKLGWALPVVRGRSVTVFDWASLLIIGLGIYTILVRLRTIFHALETRR